MQDDTRYFHDIDHNKLIATALAVGADVIVSGDSDSLCACII